MSRALAVALLIVVVPALAHAADHDVRLVEPRTFGHFVGDVVSRAIEIRTGPGEELDTASLPRPGPLSYWLELRRADVYTAGGSVRLDLDYQLLYVPIDPKSLTIPGLVVRLEAGNAAREVKIPPLGIVMSPIREIFPGTSGAPGKTFLRPDAPTRLNPTGALRSWTLASAVASVLSLALLAHYRAWWPFHKRKSRPFARAARALAHQGDAVDTTKGYLEALADLHRAFDETSGHALLAGDVGTFLDRHAEHAAERDAIERFFAASRLAFFADDYDGARRLAPPGLLVALVPRLVDGERRAR